MILLSFQNSFGNSKLPSVDFRTIAKTMYDEMSMEAFQISSCYMLIEAAYSLLLSKRIIGNAKEIENKNNVLRLARYYPGATFLGMMVMSILDSLRFTGIPAVMNYFLVNLYPLSFENTYWKEHIINIVTHQGSSYLLIAYTSYSYPNMPLESVRYSTEIMIFIFIFQNYGMVATVTNLALNSLVLFCRLRYLGW